MSIKDQGDSLTLAKGHSVFEFGSFYFSKLVELFKTKYHVQRRAAQRSRRHLTRESEVLGSIPGLATYFVSPSADSRGAVVSYWRVYVHEVLVNRLRGLSLSRKSVVRLTDRPDNMTLRCLPWT